MFHQLNSPFMLVHVKMFEKSSTIKTSWFCSQHEGKLFSNFRPPNTRRILISTEFKFSGLAVHPEHERERAPQRDGKFISFKTNEALRSHNPATLWRLHTYFNSFRVFRIISTRESERVEPPRQWQNEWVWKWSQCAPEKEGRGEWSKMNSLKINFISFILFLSVLCCSVCSQISRKCLLYCNPKVTILPLFSNNSSSCTFRNILKLKYTPLWLEISVQSFEFPLSLSVRFLSVARAMRRNGFFLWVSTPSKWNAINLWAEECFALVGILKLQIISTLIAYVHSSHPPPLSRWDSLVILNLHVVNVCTLEKFNEQNFQDFPASIFFLLRCSDL